MTVAKIQDDAHCELNKNCQAKGQQKSSHVGWIVKLNGAVLAKALPSYPGRSATGDGNVTSTFDVNPVLCTKIMAGNSSTK